jgi:hypothetical protein
MRWKHSFGDERLAFCDVNGIVQIQYGNGSSADCREADQQGASPTKVPVPPIAARMVERAQLARLRIKPRDVRTFESVAERANVTHPSLTGIDPPPSFRYFQCPLF